MTGAQLRPGDEVTYEDYTYTKRVATVRLVGPDWASVTTDKGHRVTKRLATLRLLKGRRREGA